MEKVKSISGNTTKKQQKILHEKNQKSGNWEQEIFLIKNFQDQKSHEEYVQSARDWNLGPIGERKEFQNRVVIEDELTDEAVNMVTIFVRAIRDNDMDEAMVYLHRIKCMTSVVITWQQRIDRALKSGEFTSYDKTAVDTHLMHPMSERADVRLRIDDPYAEYDYHEDFTPEALDLAKHFTHHVKRGEIGGALQCLHAIQNLDRVEINWEDRIEEAKMRGEFTDQNIGDANSTTFNIMSDRPEVKEMACRYHGDITKEAKEKRDLFAKYVREHNFDKAESLRKEVLDMNTIHPL